MSSSSRNPLMIPFEIQPEAPVNSQESKGPRLESRNMKLIAILVVAMVGVSAASLWAASPPDRQVAITVDDLPAGAAERMSGPEIDAMTSKLVATLRDQKVPAVGFVNASKLFKWGEVDERIKALRIWLDNGFEL